MTRFSAVLMLTICCVAGASSAATLTSRPSTVLFAGTAAYEIDQEMGAGLAIGFTSDGAFDFFLSGFFDPGSPGDNPFGVDMSLTDAATFGVAVNARGLEHFEIGKGFVALLFGDLTGASAADFFRGQVLAVLSDPSFPALSGDASFELRRLDGPTVIFLPASAALLAGGLALLGLVRRNKSLDVSGAASVRQINVDRRANSVQSWKVLAP